MISIFFLFFQSSETFAILHLLALVSPEMSA